MNIYLTIDTECTEERRYGPVVRPPLGYDCMMWGRFANQRNELGIPLIMRILEEYGLRGTFFVETLCSEYFGLDGLRDVCCEVRRRGHDVQLHLHPNFLEPKWLTLGRPAVPDNMADYSVDEQTELLNRGLQVLGKCGVPPSEVVGFRAGNYGANDDTWTALERVGIPVSCNYNLCYLAKDCSLDPNLRLNSFARVKDNVWEMPITNLQTGPNAYRHLEITAVSLAEMKACLSHLWTANVEHASIVMHPAEFFFVDELTGRNGRPNRMNIGRLKGLCRFLAIHRERFRVQTIADLAAGTSQMQGSEPNIIPTGSKGLRMWRNVEQALKRVDQRLRGWT